jgi:hypothetical protein
MPVTYNASPAFHPKAKFTNKNQAGLLACEYNHHPFPPFRQWYFVMIPGKCPIQHTATGIAPDLHRTSLLISPVRVKTLFAAKVG